MNALINWFVSRSLFELRLGKVANIYQQLFVCQFTFNGHYYSSGLVPTANSAVDSTANGYRNDIGYAFLLSGELSYLLHLFKCYLQCNCFTHVIFRC